MSKQLFENITDDEYKTLEEILHNPDSSPVHFFFNDPTVDGRIQELEKSGLISIKNGKINISELGRAALKEYDNIKRIKKSEHRFELIKFWVPTIISICALVISIIALIK